MRIVQFLWNMDLADGGVVRAVLDLCPALAEQGHESVLLCSNATDVPKEWARPMAPGRVRLEQIDWPDRFKRLSAKALEQARAVLADADVVHAHGMWVQCNSQILRLAASMGKPYIWSPHGMLDDWSMSQKPLRKRVMLALGGRSLLEGAAAVHCTAAAELDQARKWFPNGNGVIVPLVMDLADYRNPPPASEAIDAFGLGGSNDPIILFLSRLHHKKGVERLIDAAAELRKRGLLCRVVLAGSGDPAYVESLKVRAQAALPSACTFVGFVTGRMKISLLRAGAIFCLPSSQENFGYVVLEAMAAGTPTVTTRGVALWPDLERDGVAVICDTDVPGVVAALERLLRDRAAREALGARGRAWCLERLDGRRVAAEFVAMYQRAAAGGAGKAGARRGAAA